MEKYLAKISMLHKSMMTDYRVILKMVLQTCTEMMQDRGYDVSDLTDDAIVDCIKNQTPVLKGVDDERQIVVFFHNEERVGVKHLRRYSDMYEDHKIAIVSLEGATSFTKKECEHHFPYVQFFTFSSLCRNITKHKLVPKHKKLDSHAMNISQRQFPKIFLDDPIVQYYDFQKNDIIQITRTFGTAQPVFFYRLVCANQP